MAKRERTTLERGVGYIIYYYDGVYFLDTYRKRAEGFETLKGARESAYYKGLRETKE